mmetsp:Transcript_3477/g.8510  ORF Transcript_3477/g.8510 Transcript_3477/m.8510 type:complete len:397 (+) Transcript_3477:56-1246(+)
MSQTLQPVELLPLQLIEHHLLLLELFALHARICQLVHDGRIHYPVHRRSILRSFVHPAICVLLLPRSFDHVGEFLLQLLLGQHLVLLGRVDNPVHGCRVLRFLADPAISSAAQRRSLGHRRSSSLLLLLHLRSCRWSPARRLLRCQDGSSSNPPQSPSRLAGTEDPSLSVAEHVLHVGLAASSCLHVLTNLGPRRRRRSLRPDSSIGGMMLRPRSPVTGRARHQLRPPLAPLHLGALLCGSRGGKRVHLVRGRYRMGPVDRIHSGEVCGGSVRRVGDQVCCVLDRVDRSMSQGVAVELYRVQVQTPRALGQHGLASGVERGECVRRAPFLAEFAQLLDDFVLLLILLLEQRFLLCDLLFDARNLRLQVHNLLGSVGPDLRVKRLHLRGIMPQNVSE